MYVCKYVRMYVCIYVRMYVFMHICMYVCNFFSFLKENTLHPNVQRIKRCLFRDSHKTKTHFMDQILSYLLLKPVGNYGNRCALRC